MTAALALQRALARFGLWLEWLLLAICICLLSGMFFCVFTGVVIRYVVTVPFPWTEEIARFCLIWFALLAASIGARHGFHFSFQWGVMYLPERQRVLARQAGNVAVIAFLALLLWQSFSLVEVMSNQTAVASEIDMRVPAYGIVFGLCMLMTIHVLEVLDALLALVTGKHLSIRELYEEEKYKTLRPGAGKIPTPPEDSLLLQK